MRPELEVESEPAGGRSPKSPDPRLGSTISYVRGAIFLLSNGTRSRVAPPETCITPPVTVRNSRASFDSSLICPTDNRGLRESQQRTACHSDPTLGQRESHSGDS